MMVQSRCLDRNGWQGHRQKFVFHLRVFVFIPSSPETSSFRLRLTLSFSERPSIVIYVMIHSQPPFLTSAACQLADRRSSRAPFLPLSRSCQSHHPRNPISFPSHAMPCHAAASRRLYHPEEGRVSAQTERPIRPDQELPVSQRVSARSHQETIANHTKPRV